MRVKIIKSKKPTYWYADKIGEEYEVEEAYVMDTWKLEDFPHLPLRKSDCIILPDPVPSGHASLNAKPQKVNLVIGKDQVYAITFADREGHIIINTTGNDPMVTIGTNANDGNNLETYLFTHEV
jgi:hypothetical protein